MKNFILKITRYNQESINPNHPLDQVPGMGRFTVAALKRYGIETAEQFSIFTEDEVETLLGKSGLKLLQNARKLSYA
jgi:nucleotidyltransferase/DNA polymerase involved in DNA repair